MGPLSCKTNIQKGPEFTGRLPEPAWAQEDAVPTAAELSGLPWMAGSNVAKSGEMPTWAWRLRDRSRDFSCPTDASDTGRSVRSPCYRRPDRRTGTPAPTPKHMFVCAALRPSRSSFLRPCPHHRLSTPKNLSPITSANAAPPPPRYRRHNRRTGMPVQAP